ncbi:hypothetical protein [Haliangium ochraceum]|uniref:Lipoprotein n=1 Tax=Haliangium ochraceum (strain DSM 14365 / JCM 11303 / SMP-2) TaxID=502025 RepID=D0LJ61_HALO1|nr:hypothetical protein [Haliangium ochraceum]ACY14908.1 hypothetical protein Hoch_2370 [Haliangium ochraceum DSM 14365]
MKSTRWTALALALACAALALGCGGRRSDGPKHPRPLPVEPTLGTGECGDPARDGVIGEAPTLSHADRDLDGDGEDEVVVADRDICTPEGNCHWNVFHDDAGCLRYLGTLSAARVQRLGRRGERGFSDVRAVWYLTGQQRLLVQEYRFLRGGYRIAEVLLCRQSDDDIVQCAEVDESAIH